MLFVKVTTYILILKIHIQFKCIVHLYNSFIYHIAYIFLIVCTTYTSCVYVCVSKYLENHHFFPIHDHVTYIVNSSLQVFPGWPPSELASLTGLWLYANAWKSAASVALLPFWDYYTASLRRCSMNMWVLNMVSLYFLSVFRKPKLIQLSATKDESARMWCICW